MTYTSYSKGINAESICSDYLLKQKYDIIHSRYSNIYGEIDIIAKYGKTLCFIEVKTRKTKLVYDIVTPKQKRRYIESAAYFISENEEFLHFYTRFDFLFLGKKKIRHIKNAWHANDLSF